ncbi:hypothetical protein [Streptomyces sp. NPDC058424]|uniref:hypothetical protein n=1 Tax=Streptomyces sp. NPDC058424 TaxID=3346491 RepID=UPI00364B000E
MSGLAPPVSAWSCSLLRASTRRPQNAAITTRRVIRTAQRALRHAGVAEMEL